MTTATARVAAEPRPWVDRLLAVAPLLSLYLWLCVLYGWEAFGHVTLWLNGDELEMSQLSRAVAETGETARRGAEINVRALYPYVIAPVWWIDDVGKAYGTLKFVNVLMMSSVVFPTYGLARMVVTKPWALFAAAGAGTIPALYYAPMVLEEPLAYPWATLCAFLIAKSLALQTRWWVAAAVGASVLAPIVREQLAIIPVAFAVAAVAMFAVSERARRVHRRWTTWDRVGALVFAVGIVILFNAFASHYSYAWEISTRYYKDRMLDYGLWAVGALTIGVGVFPMVAGLSALFGVRGEPWTRERRAFVATCGALIVGYAWYMAIKAAYISTVFSTLVVERNLIYVAPLLFVATAMFFERPGVRWWAAAGAVALTLVALLAPYGDEYKMGVRIYADAPGFALLQAANRAWAWTPEHARNVLLGMLVLSVLLVLVPRLLPRGVRPVFAGVAVLLLLWTVGGQLSAASASNTVAEEFTADIDEPLNWIDRETGGAPTVYLGQRLTDFNGLWQMEFWNRSLRHVWSTDGSAPGPGPTLTPDVTNGRTGEITQPPADVTYAVVEPGIDIVGDVVRRHGHVAGSGRAEWRLVEIAKPLRLQNTTRGVSQDGWAGAQTDYTQFSTPGNAPGFAVVRVHRKGWGGKDRPRGGSRVVIRVGALRIGNDSQPALGRVTARCEFKINRLEDRTFLLQTPRPPFHVDVRVAPTFVPNEIDPKVADTRHLGAQVAYSFSPSSTVAPELRGCAAALSAPDR